MEQGRRHHIGFCAFILLAFLLVDLAAAPAFAQSDRPLEDEAQEAQARTLMQEIRCVVCQNQSIVDSNADIAGDLRRIIRKQVSEGKSNDAIKAFLVDRYGDWVLLSPPLNPGTVFLWLSPVLFLLIGGIIVLKKQHKQSSTLTPTALSDSEKQALQALLEEEVMPDDNNDTDGSPRKMGESET